MNLRFLDSAHVIKEMSENGILISLIHLHVFGAQSKRPQGKVALNSDSWNPQTQVKHDFPDPSFGELEASWFSFPTLVFKQLLQCSLNK